MLLRGKTIVITGASSGIGAATARACAAAGMNVVVTARRADRLIALVEEITSDGGHAVAVVGDVADDSLDERLLVAADEHFAHFDAVFANAGYGRSCPQTEEHDDELRAIFEVNFFAAVRLLKRAARTLVDEGRPGHLLMCSSCVSKFALPLYGSYAATKAAQASICQAMRLEMAPENIMVTSVHPVTTTTEFSEASARRRGHEPKPGEVPRHAVRLFTQPAERVARAVVRCLERPRPEVWTSTATRLAAALFTVSPRFGDRMLRRQMREEGSS